ncbi:MAG: hypothetical protein WAU10_07495 [Caldilineaceae bacterium]
MNQRGYSDRRIYRRQLLPLRPQCYPDICCGFGILFVKIDARKSPLQPFPLGAIASAAWQNTEPEDRLNEDGDTDEKLISGSVSREYEVTQRVANRD